MILLLTLLVLVLIILLIYVNYQFGINKELHSKKIVHLQNIILELLEEQKKQSLDLKLSEELKKKLLSARFSLDENILDLQQDLIAAVIKKNKDQP